MSSGQNATVNRTCMNGGCPCCRNWLPDEYWTAKAGEPAACGGDAVGSSNELDATFFTERVAQTTQHWVHGSATDQVGRRTETAQVQLSSRIVLTHFCSKYFVIYHKWVFHFWNCGKKWVKPCFYLLLLLLLFSSRPASQVLPIGFMGEADSPKRWGSPSGCHYPETHLICR